MKRRFFVLLISAAALSLASHVSFARAEGDESGFRPIFNGRNLDGWDGDPKFWSVKDGVLIGETTPENKTQGNTFCLWRQGDVDDFELRLSFRTTSEWANSGIQIRSHVLENRRNNWVVGGYQADIEHPKMTGNLWDEEGRGELALRGHTTTIGRDSKPVEGPPTGDSDDLIKLVHEHDWNDYTVLAQGNHLVTKINGHVMAETTDDDAAHRTMSGLLAVQIHEGKPMHVEFKNIRLKRLRLTDRKKVVMVAGSPSHGPGEHEFRAGTILLKKCLDRNAPQVLTAAYFNGWPTDPTAFDNADAIFLYMDGGGGHPVIQQNRLAQIDNLTKQGVGLVCAHYAVEIPKERGGSEFLRWIGGYYEHNWSVNPTWMLSHPQLATDHPIVRGVKPFDVVDEWYYHIHFPEKMDGITPILSAIPPDKTHDAPNGHPSDDPEKDPYKFVHDRKGQIEALSWAIERPDGGRGYGFTGGHFHKNWANDDYRKLMLNAILWAAKAEVPADGVNSTVTPEEMKANMDKKK